MDANVFAAALSFLIIKMYVFIENLELSGKLNENILNFSFLVVAIPRLREI